MSTLTKSTTDSTSPAQKFGVLLSHAFENQVHGSFSTRLLAAAEARRIAGAQPGIEFEIMETTPDGWRSADGRTADQVARDRWGGPEAMRLAFTPDTHFDHALLSRLRGFDTTADHDEHIV